MTRTRFHHLTVCLLCAMLLYCMAGNYVFLSGAWWLTIAAASYATQPFYNEIKPLVVHLWPKRKPIDPYVLVGK
jgi:hypothetical protein